MSDTVIQVDSLGKKFRSGARPAYGRFSELLVNGARESVRWAHNRAIGLFSQRNGKPSGLREHEFWALKDVSFEVKRGEVLGIIGRNGAGKSTLLKLLSRITRPTTGEIRLRGRVGSLLEVGTGFHPELTGRENIYLNGTILGMRKGEIDRKFDEIVAFAETETFLDTPVKQYSSGMYTRLAFAVAAHLEPQILLIDEVLAVGDGGFQSKCLGKIQEIARSGRTVFFVSHNMSAVRRLCSRAIILASGKVTAMGQPGPLVEQYVDALGRIRDVPPTAEQIATMPPDPAIRFHEVVVSQEQMQGPHFVTGKPIRIRTEYSVLADTSGLRVHFSLLDVCGETIFRSICGSELERLPLVKAGRYVSEAEIPADWLAPVVYEVAVSASIYGVRHCLARPITAPLAVHDLGTIKHAYALNSPIGVRIAPYIRWVTREASVARSY